MALVVTEAVAEISSTSNANNYAFGAFNPAANSVLVVMAFATDTTAAGTCTSVPSQTWTQQKSQLYNAVDTAYLYTAVIGAAPGSTVVTVRTTGDNASGMFAVIFQVTGADVSGTPVRQTAKGAATGANPVVTMGSAMLTGNAYLAAFGIDRTTPASTQPTGWTEIADGGYDTPPAGGSGAYRVNGETGTTITFTAATGDYGILACELNALVVIVDGAAAGSGVGIGAATGLMNVLATAAASGVGIGLGSALLEILASAAASGIGLGTANGEIVINIAAAGSGVGIGASGGLLEILAVAPGSGIGIGTAVSLVEILATAAGNGVGIGVSQGIVEILAAAQGSGIGIGTSDALLEILATALGSGIGIATADGEVIVMSGIIDGSAAGAGVGTATANGLVEILATALGSGTGLATANGLLEILATALGEGVGLGNASGEVIIMGPLVEGNALGSGVGMATADGLVEVLGTALGSARGTAQASPYFIIFAIAQGSGIGTGRAKGQAGILFAKSIIMAAPLYRTVNRDAGVGRMVEFDAAMRSVIEKESDL